MHVNRNFIRISPKLETTPTSRNRGNGTTSCDLSIPWKTTHDAREWAARGHGGLRDFPRKRAGWAEGLP